MSRQPAARSGGAGDPVGRDHYSYTLYADPATARTFDDRRFGGPIGELVASLQARVLIDMIGECRDRAILDVGTGTGRAALLLARDGARVTGIDASAEMLAVARQRAADARAGIAFHVMDAHALAFPDRAFDVAVSMRLLMHTEKWHQCVNELCRVADRLVILDYPSARSAARIQALIRRLFYAMGCRTEPYRVFSDGEVAAALAAGGFRIRSIHRQFVLPIALHKAIGSVTFTRSVETALARAGLLASFGSPVTLVAERCTIS